MMETAFELSDTVARLKVPIANPPVRQFRIVTEALIREPLSIGKSANSNRRTANLVETLRGLDALSTQGINRVPR
jgi:hypothetical protein